MEKEITSLEQSILNARAEFVCSVTDIKLPVLALNHNLPLEIIEECYKKENWVMQRTAYLASASNELNIRTQTKKAEENFESLNLMALLRSKGVQQIIKRIDNDEYDMTVGEAVNLIKSIDTLGRQLEGQFNNNGGVVNNKILNVNFTKPVEEMTIEELKESRIKMKSALLDDAEEATYE